MGALEKCKTMVIFVTPFYGWFGRSGRIYDTAIYCVYVIYIAKCTTVCAGYINTFILVSQFYKVYLKFKDSLINSSYFGI